MLLKKIIPLWFKTFLKKHRKFNSINNLDKKILNYINFKNGFYIECGANDGVNQSNTWYFEKSLNWKGILIEPSKQKFDDLKNNRSSRNIFVNAALVSGDFKNKKKKFFLSNNNLESKIKNKKSLGDEEINTDTLNNILSKHKVKTINFFSLDVEGYEENVLKGLNLNKFNIDYILIETSNFDKISFLLKKNNYKFLKKLSDHDYLFQKIKL